MPETTAPPRSARTLRVPAADPDRAQSAQEHLRQQGVDVDGVDGRFVLVPAGWSALFVWDLAEAMGEFGHDDELAAWANLAAGGR